MSEAMEYPDTNNDGVPDAFENRRPISEILNSEPTPAQTYGTIVIEVEKRPRDPKKGEYFFCGSNSIQRATFDYSKHKAGRNDGFMVIKRIIAGNLDGYGER